MKTKHILLTISLVILFAALFFVNIAYQNSIAERESNAKEAISTTAKFVDPIIEPQSMAVPSVTFYNDIYDQSELTPYLRIPEDEVMEECDDEEDEYAEDMINESAYERHQEESNPHVEGSYPEKGWNSSLGLGGNLGGGSPQPKQLDYQP